ncbi:MAG: beta-galactosidase [Chloroflexi bacterium]|nr:beta-galactosidase [Chloroflexota bacterium]
MRLSRALIGLGLVVVIGAAGLGAARCPTEEPAGSGLLEFAGGADARAMDADLALGVNPLFTWAELEPVEGAYNWAPLDEVLANAHARGRKVAPRVYTNAGDFDQATPGWVFDAGAAAYTLGDGSGTPQPVPTDAVFTAKFGAFLAALGARYNGNPDIEFFQTNAGMGAYGEMVWSLDVDAVTAGHSADAMVATVEYWIDRWRAAFPDTHLGLMENFIGQGIAERVTEYAVDRGFYLQSNSPDQTQAAAAILAAHDDRTKIVLEIENRGCNGATGDEFGAIADRVASYGFAVDYLVVCGETLDDAGATQRAYDLLRRG